MNALAAELTPKEKAQAVVDALKLSIRAVFVPFSKSRNRAEKQPSLNWIVTVIKDGRDVLTTDYMAGSGHCPAYKKPTKFKDGRTDKYLTDKRIAQECEAGRECPMMYENIGMPAKDKAIEPNTLDVLYSLALDSSVIDCGTFEDWADNFGYEHDSRSAEATYRACLDTALKLRTALGDSGLTALREAFQDY